jgi:RNA polymerase sigma-70 factor (ECF subfamily)
MPGNVGAAAESIDVDERLEQHRFEVTALCQRMLGPSDAEDAVQETFLRAWRSVDRFEGRSSFRTWLYRIATNASLDMLAERKRRARPIDVGPGAAPFEQAVGGPSVIAASAVGADSRVMAGVSAEDAVIERESIRRAFDALRQLPPKQRAVVILRDIMRWRASEVAELLGTSVPAVNSALQRARTTLGTTAAT